MKHSLSVNSCDIFILAHYNDVIMNTIASQITSLTIVYSTVYSGKDQRKYQSSASLALLWGIHQGLVNSPHERPVTREMSPFDYVIMWYNYLPTSISTLDVLAIGLTKCLPWLFWQLADPIFTMAVPAIGLTHLKHERKKINDNTVTTYIERQGVSNHWQLNCLLNSQSALDNKGNIEAWHYWPFATWIHWCRAGGPTCKGPVIWKAFPWHEVIMK